MISCIISRPVYNGEVPISRALLLALFAGTLCAQQQPDVAAQRDAMKKLSFMLGKWSGEATSIGGTGEAITVKQTEDVQYRLNGLLLLVEGTGRNPKTGEVVFNALATITYDDATSTYKFRAYTDGRYLDTDLKVADNGFEWGFQSGPATVQFVMRLNEKGEWVETGDVKVGDRPPHRTLDMTVRHQN